MIKPYYESEGITIYHGDCREILPQLDKVDLVLTDPPYGIADIFNGGRSGNWGNARSLHNEFKSWDISPPTKSELQLVSSKGEVVIIWGGNYMELPPSRCWLVWNKPERGFSLAEAELAWTNKDAVVRVIDCHRYDSNKEHPTQKPLEVMTWCINQAGNPQTILDPFMGSGTTLVAAKNLNRKAIGIEIEEKYCEIAVKRLAQMNLFYEDEQVTR